MFSINDRVICLNGEWINEDGSDTTGPKEGEIVTVLDIIEEKEIGLKFNGHSQDYFTASSFRKLVSDQELNEYREKVSKVELQELIIEPVNCLELEVTNKLKLKYR